MTRKRTWTVRKPVIIGMAALVMLVGGIGTWSTQVEIAGAVLGRGNVEIEDNKVVIQHPAGGVVEEIHARNGDFVAAGDILLRLDGARLLTELNTVEGELIETLAKEARHEAEVDNRHELEIGGYLTDRAGTDPAARETVVRQQRLLEAGYEEADRRANLLNRKIAQVEEQIAAVDAQMVALDQEISFLDVDLANAERMVERKLVKAAHFTAVRRDSAKLRGNVGRLAANRAELAEKSIEFELELLAIPADRRRKASEELSKLQPIRIKLTESRTDLMTRLANLEVRAPVAGHVHESQVAGRRSVIEDGKPIMWIVPTDQPAVAVVRIDAGDIEQVYRGQETMLRFSSFSRRATPLLPGRAITISADALQDPTTRAHYYEVRVAFSKEEFVRLVAAELVPGMPVEAYFATEKQTPFTYVTRPLVEYFNHAYRDT